MSDPGPDPDEVDADVDPAPERDSTTATDGPVFRDRAVYLPGPDALVCADLHLGMDAQSAVELPMGEDDAIVERFTALVERFAPASAVLAGDVLHSFSSVPATVPDRIAALDRAAAAVDAELVITPGNHDGLLDGVWDGPTRVEHLLDDGTVVCHGHDRSGTTADRYVIGHDHPVITIEGQRRPCYLRGPVGPDGRPARRTTAAEMLMLPSFTRLAAGAVINGMSARDFQSPLVTDADALSPIVRDDAADETHVFPPLGEFRRLL